MQKKRCLFSLIALFLLNQDFCEAQEIYFSPNPVFNAVCPNTSVTYGIYNYAPACHEISVSGGAIIPDANPDDHELTISWFDQGLPGSISVSRDSSAACAGAAPGKTVAVPVKTLVGVAPAILGPDSVAAGFQEYLTFKASLNYPFRGSFDPDPFEVKTFEWTAPVAWTILSEETWAPLRLKTDFGTGGTVTAKGLNTCELALKSETASAAVKRTLSTPCPVLTGTQIVLCGEPWQIDLIASPQPYSYQADSLHWSWSLPEGWSLDSLSDARMVRVNADGQHGGSVTATVSDYGISASCPLSIPVVVAAPGTWVVGSQNLCEAQPYYLSNPTLPQGASASWQITPPDAPVTSFSGTGANAVVTPTTLAPFYPGSHASITFTVQGCGLTESFQRTFFVGSADIFNFRVDGVPGQNREVCPGWHKLEADVLSGDVDSCFSWVLPGNNGTPPNLLYHVDCSSAYVYVQPTDKSPLTVGAIYWSGCKPYEEFFELTPTLPECDYEAFSLKVYPNPTADILNIEASTIYGGEIILLNISNIRLINMQGAVALEISGDENPAVKLDVSGIPAGLYLVRVQSADRVLVETVQVY
ncbi:MAG: T9SS type A sorting domain-containing protein [Bacteroidota bacterium]